MFEREVILQAPMSEHEVDVLLHDLQCKISVYRAFQILDIYIRRQSHPIKSGKISLYILAGEPSCGKSKLALAIANTIGKCDCAIINFNANDQLALSKWWEAENDV